MFQFIGSKKQHPFTFITQMKWDIALKKSEVIPYETKSIEEEASSTCSKNISWISGWWFQTHLKNICQNGNLPQIGMKKRNTYLKPPPSHTLNIVCQHTTLRTVLKVTKYNHPANHHSLTSTNQPTNISKEHLNRGLTLRHGWYRFDLRPWR